MEKNNRKGDWFLTYTGQLFWPMDPRPEEICIEDIAHQLSMICRFNGCTRVHYSVAQHSVMVADILPPHLKFYGLMHDATEAYIGDMIKPLKRSLPSFQEVEALVWDAIVFKYDIASAVYPANAALVKEADNIALMTERRDLLVKSPHEYSTKAEPLPDIIQPLTPAQAEKQFLEMFEKLHS